jgi:DNA polymerase
MPYRDTAFPLVALLAWYRDMGADEAIGTTPIDWFGRPNAAPGDRFSLKRAGRARVLLPSGPEATSAAAQLRVPAAAPHIFRVDAPNAAVMAARAAARSAATLEELQATLARFDGCGLKLTAKNLCFYRGMGRAPLMLIGEAPGRDEDLEGKPFVGRAGQLLDKMLAAIGLSERDVHITNIVYWRPPGNRTPTPQEAQVCRPFLERQIELVAPKIVVLLGGAAAKHLLEVSEGIMRVRGKWHELTVGAHTARAMATLHPAYLLRTPAAKRLAWRDLLAIGAALRR